MKLKHQIELVRLTLEAMKDIAGTLDSKYGIVDVSYIITSKESIAVMKHEGKEYTVVTQRAIDRN